MCFQCVYTASQLNMEASWNGGTLNHPCSLHFRSDFPWNKPSILGVPPFMETPLNPFLVQEISVVRSGPGMVWWGVGAVVPGEFRGISGPHPRWSMQIFPGFVWKWWLKTWFHLLALKKTSCSLWKLPYVNHPGHQFYGRPQLGFEDHLWSLASESAAATGTKRLVPALVGRQMGASQQIQSGREMAGDGFFKAGTSTLW